MGRGNEVCAHAGNLSARLSTSSAAAWPCSLPAFAPSPHRKEAQQADGSAGGVKQDIPNAALARRDKGLVEFIACRVERRQAHGQPRFRPTPGRNRSSGRLVQRTPKQECQHSKFSQMGAFAGGDDNGMDCIVRQMRKEPAHDRPDDARGTLEGRAVAGRGEDNHHPDQQWQPIFDEHP